MHCAFHWNVLCISVLLFKTIWPDVCIVYLNHSFQTTWLLSRPYDLILVLCTQLTTFKTIWSNFITLNPIDCFQDHLTWFYHCVPNWLLSRPYDQIFALCTQLTPFKTICPNFIIMYPIDSFQDHMNWFLHCVPNLLNWLLSRPFDQIFVLFTQLTPVKTIWSDFLHCVHKLPLSRPYDLIVSFCTQLTPFKTIWPNFIIMYTIDSFQDHLT